MKGIKVTPNMESISEVAAYVEGVMDEAGVPMQSSVKVNIVVDEIYSNIVHYSGANRAEAQCEVTKEGVWLCFRDNGMPYNPLEKEDPDVDAPLEEREIGGLGIFMTKILMDRMEYEYKDGENIVTLFTALEGENI